MIINTAGIDDVNNTAYSWEEWVNNPDAEFTRGWINEAPDEQVKQVLLRSGVAIQGIDKDKLQEWHILTALESVYWAWSIVPYWFMTPAIKEKATALSYPFYRKHLDTCLSNHYILIQDAQLAEHLNRLDALLKKHEKTVFPLDRDDSTQWETPIKRLDILTDKLYLAEYGEDYFNGISYMVTTSEGRYLYNSAQEAEAFASSFSPKAKIQTMITVQAPSWMSSEKVWFQMLERQSS